MKTLSNIPGLKPEDEVVIKKFKYGDKAKIHSSCLDLKISPNSQKASVDFDMGEYKIIVLDRGIVKAPFITQIQSKRKFIENDMEDETGEFLFKEILEYNKMQDLSDVQKKSEQSLTEEVGT